MGCPEPRGAIRERGAMLAVTLISGGFDLPNFIADLGQWLSLWLGFAVGYALAYMVIDKILKFFRAH